MYYSELERNKRTSDRSCSRNKATQERALDWNEIYTTNCISTNIRIEQCTNK